MNDREYLEAAHSAGGPSSWPAVRKLEVSANLACNLAGASWRGSQDRCKARCGTRASDHDGYLRADRPGGTTAGNRKAIGLR